MHSENTTAISFISPPAGIADGIQVFESDPVNGYFEAAYNTDSEPWNYSRRGSEKLRHQYSVERILAHRPGAGQLLELGCSKGLMTSLLIPHFDLVAATDISMTALKSCKALCDPLAEAHQTQVAYLKATLPRLPFAAASFDVVTVCDGFAGWWFTEENKRLALEDIYRVLKTNGIAIISDFLMPDSGLRQFVAYKAAVQESPLAVGESTYLYDRPWYALESMVKKLGLGRLCSSLLSSIGLAGMLHSFGRLLGPVAANHMIIIARK